MKSSVPTPPKKTDKWKKKAESIQPFKTGYTGMEEHINLQNILPKQNGDRLQISQPDVSNDQGQKNKHRWGIKGHALD